MTEESGLIVHQQEPIGELSVLEMSHQVTKIQELMKALMKDGEHFGVIPGTSSKKVLLKPGAEKLGLMFRLAPEFDITRRDLPRGHVEYEIVCRLIHIPTGRLIGSGVGLCSTRESKYAYRGGSFTCPNCGASAIIKGKVEYGGGWLCWTKKGGCNAKFPDAQFSGQPERVENPDLADSMNTVLKMAKKRAHVDAMLTATAASDIFTQDVIEEPAAEFSPEYPFVEKPVPKKPSAKKPLDDTYAKAKAAVYKATSEEAFEILRSLLKQRHDEGRLNAIEHSELTRLVDSGLEQLRAEHEKI